MIDLDISTHNGLTMRCICVWAVMWMHFSDKVLVYVLGLLICAHSQATLVPSLAGALTGALYRLNFLNMRHFRVRRSPTAG